MHVHARLTFNPPIFMLFIIIFISVKTNRSTNMIIYIYTNICHAGQEQQV